MNAYLVRIREERGALYFGGDLYEPPEPWFPIGVFVAATRGQAKADALSTWSHSSRSGVYEDDWPNLRTNVLAHDVELLNPADVSRGEYETGPLHNFFWLRVHEVLDHGGARCTCPEYLEDEAGHAA